MLGPEDLRQNPVRASAGEHARLMPALTAHITSSRYFLIIDYKTTHRTAKKVSGVAVAGWQSLESICPLFPKAGVRLGKIKEF
jgi:hypothetical protein